MPRTLLPLMFSLIVVLQGSDLRSAEPPAPSELQHSGRTRMILTSSSMSPITLTDQRQPAPAQDELRAAPAVRVARLINNLNRRSDARRSSVPVFRDESEFAASSDIAPHHQGHFYSDRYGYTPDCRCNNQNYAAGLWSGYCETRAASWHSGWLLRRFYNDCQCDDCGPKSAK